MTEIEVTTTKYKATDGKVFSDKKDCVAYEYGLNLTSIYIVTYVYSDTIEAVFSKKCDADIFISKKTGDYGIEEFKIDKELTCK